MSKSAVKTDSSVDKRASGDYPGGALPEGFWRGRAMEDLSAAEWEALCDGCAKCCLHKVEYGGAVPEVHYTNIRCRLLNASTCRCTDYPNRSARVPDCVTLDAAAVREAYWLPETCAYRLLADGRDLPDWHPLVSGSALSVRRSGNSVCGRTIAEEDAGHPEHHIVTWVRC